MVLDSQFDRRGRVIRRVRARLERQSSPRIQMTAIVVVTGCVGFLSAVGLLFAGLETIWLRYALAVLIAYVTFLGCVRVWLALAGRELGRGLDFVDFYGVPIGHESGPSLLGGGGDFGGGGATASFEAPHSGASAASSTGGGGGLDVSLDESAWLVALVAAVFAAAIAAGYIVFTAPALFAEVLIDGVLTVGLYRRFKRIQHQHWLEGALRRTVVPVAVVLVFFVVAGAALQAYAPEARSIGGVWRHFVESRLLLAI